MKMKENFVNHGLLGNLVFESTVVGFDGKKYKTRVRELQKDDSEDIVRIVKDYSKNATLFLYDAYRKGREQIIRGIGDERLDNVLEAFKRLDERFPGKVAPDANIIKKYIGKFQDD
jgi:hypothetical protein